MNAAKPSIPTHISRNSLLGVSAAESIRPLVSGIVVVQA